jgi:uncharacterized protein (DUF1501 family)
MSYTRRDFITAKAASAGPVLVCIFQRGAADGLNAVVPYGDADYYRHRPNIAVPRPGQAGGAINLNGFFGLNPALQALQPLYASGRLALVHACAFPHQIRSHFEAQTLTEAGVANKNQIGSSGWIGRYLKATAKSSDRPMRAVSISGAVPLSMQGASDPLAIDDIANFGLGDVDGIGYRQTLSMLYPASTPYADVAGAALGAIDELTTAIPTQFTPENGASYPGSALGLRLKQAAQLIKADLGVEVLCLDSDGWDHHENLPNYIAQSLTDLGAALSAFATDLGGQLNRVTVVVMTEFGRRVPENGSRGTDHGTAGCTYLLGGGVNGGQVAGSWPGLANAALALGEDLAMTTDLRGVLTQLLQRRFGYSGAGLFPGYNGGNVPDLFLG